VLRKTFANLRLTARLEVFNDHEKHAPKFTPAWGRAKPSREEDVAAGRVPALSVPGLNPGI
jgi:hypothetical protein